MEREFLAILILALPLLVFPAAFAWYVNTGVIARLVRRRRRYTLFSVGVVRDQIGYQEIPE